MTDLTADLYGLPPNLAAVSHAILNQESGNNPNSPTSVDGAVGRAQITPSTFKQYALPGEDINNPDDNLAVHNRIIADLAQKSGNDPARIAAGYFSGPGNIASADSTTPYKADRADGNGKKVSAYVSDVVKRLNPVGTANATEVAAPVEAAKPAAGVDLTADLYGDTQVSPPSQPESVIQKHGQQGWDAINAYQQGKQTLPETALQVLGKAGAGTISDYTGNALSALYHGIATPNVRQEISSLGDTVLGRGAKDLAQQAGGAYGDFSQANPRAARNLESVADLASVLPFGGKAVSATGQGLTELGSAVEKSGQASAATSKAKFVQSLITPKETPTVASDLFSRSKEKGILRSRVVQPTAQEQAVIDTVSQLPVSGNKSLLANHNIIEDAKNAEAQGLIDRLKKNDVPISDDTVINALSSTYDNLKNSPYITGDGQLAANKVITGALEHITANPSTASGLLQARKDFDAWVRRLKSERAFDPITEGPVTTAIQQVRQTINGLVGQAVPVADVQTSLAKQSNLYRAMDNIQTKGGAEGKNIISRTAQKAAKAIPVKGALAKAAVATGVAGGAALAPALTGGALAAYAAQKAIRSSALRKGVGYTLKTAGNAIK